MWDCNLEDTPFFFFGETHAALHLSWVSVSTHEPYDTGLFPQKSTMKSTMHYDIRNGTSFCVFLIDASRAPSLFRQQEISHHVSVSTNWPYDIRLFLQKSPIIHTTKDLMFFMDRFIPSLCWQQEISHQVMRDSFGKEPYNTRNRTPFVFIDFSTLSRPLEISR